jgi:hypothetical protein
MARHTIIVTMIDVVKITLTPSCPKYIAHEF